MYRVLGDFARTLRSHQLPVSPQEMIDAIAAINLTGYGERDTFKSLLGITLAKSATEKEIFDSCFEQFFATQEWHQFIASTSQLTEPDTPYNDDDTGTQPSSTDGSTNTAEQSARANSSPLATGMASDSIPADDSDSLDKPTEIYRRSQYRYQRLQKMATQVGLSQLRYKTQLGYYGERMLNQLQLDTEERLQLRPEVRTFVERELSLYGNAQSQEEQANALRSVPLGSIETHLLEQLYLLLKQMAQRLKLKRPRRYPSRHHGALHVNATLRRSICHDGIPVEIIRQRRHTEHAKIYVLCDASHSVGVYAQFFLYFLYSFKRSFATTRGFVFSSQLGEVTREFSDSSLPHAIAKAISAWGSGFTDYGAAFSMFDQLCGKVLNQRSILIILGDARNNNLPSHKDILRRLSRRCRHVAWLNPETPSLWNYGDSIMDEYTRHCSYVSHCNTLAHYEEFFTWLLAHC